MRNRLIFLITITALLALAGCRNSSIGGGFDEGEIHYKIIYNNPGGTLPMELMPNTMVVKFKDDKTIMEITAPIGNSGIYNIIDLDEELILTYISFLSIKYYYQGVTGETPPGIDPMDDMKFIRTGQTSNINGFNCKHAIAELPGLDRKFDIWFTSDINLDDPNNSTPYRDIDGVLMSFFYKMGDMIVEFEATGAYQKEITDKDFVKSDKFLRISRKDMDNIISKMMCL